MCDPMTALTVAQGVATVAGGAQQARAVNSAARKTYRSAIESEANQNVGIDQRLLQETEALNMQGYNAALEAAAARSSAQNSAAGRGVTGRTITALMAEQSRIGARKANELQARKDAAVANAAYDKRSVNQQTQARIEATPTQSFGLTDLLISAAPAALSVARQHQDTKRHNQQLELLARGE